jgi:hypothetical protein
MAPSAAGPAISSKRRTDGTMNAPGDYRILLALFALANGSIVRVKEYSAV